MCKSHSPPFLLGNLIASDCHQQWISRSSVNSTSLGFKPASLQKQKIMPLKLTQLRSKRGMNMLNLGSADTEIARIELTL